MAMARIAIVGAGIADLKSALTPHDAGIATTIYEASTEVGGRMRSNTSTWANGQVSDWCGELIDSSHAAVQLLAQRFQLTPERPASRRACGVDRDLLLRR
jgi:monoamine oxidase